MLGLRLSAEPSVPTGPSAESAGDRPTKQAHHFRVMRLSCFCAREGGDVGKNGDTIRGCLLADVRALSTALQAPESWAHLC
jgi:hypothetical protein